MANYNNTKSPNRIKRHIPPTTPYISRINAMIYHTNNLEEIITTLENKGTVKNI